MDENNRNFILAIVLSIGVLFAWQYYFVPKHPVPATQTTEQQQTEQQTEQGPPQPPGGGEVQSGGAPQPGPSAAPTMTPRGGAGAKSARRHRDAEHERLDRSEGRAHRRSDAQGISRDGRARRARSWCCCRRPAARTLITPSMAGSRRAARISACPDRHALDGGLGRTADAAIAGDAQLRQRQGPQIHAHHLARRQIHVYRRRPGGQYPAPRR